MSDIDTTDDPNRPDWFLYKRTGDSAARDRLIVAYTPLVKYVAGRVGAGLPQSVEQSDLVSYGTFGLIDAIDKFDLERGFKFETYAISRIKGAILDELRSIDWVPRSVRSKQKAVDTAIRKLEGDHKRTPTEEEIATELELTVPELRALRSSVGNTYITGFEELQGEDQPDVADVLIDTTVNIDGEYSQNEDIDGMRDALARGFAQMGEREKMVLTLYYQEGLTLAEVGVVFGVTESRVCQIHTQAVEELRSLLAASELEPA